MQKNIYLFFYHSTSFTILYFQVTKTMHFLIFTLHKKVTFKSPEKLIEKFHLDAKSDVYAWKRFQYVIYDGMYTH